MVYQVYPRSFADSNGDGIGDIPGLISKLDYLEALGVDVVWVSPFYQSPQDDNGYDISDYQAVDPEFGTLADVDDLIDELHRRGMKLMVDVVINHTSDEHPWFIESRRSANSPKRDWYWWRPARPGRAAPSPGTEPTNWVSFFSEPAWEWDERTSEYYLHLFSRRQPDLNWENPEVRDALYDMLRWWLDRGVDAFRLDVINLVSKRLPLADGPLIGDGPYGDGTDEYTCGPRIHEFMAEMNATVIAETEPPVMTVGEMPGVTLAEAARFTDPYSRELDMVFQFDHVRIDHAPGDKFQIEPLSLTRLKGILGRWQEGLADAGWNSLYWNNHDQPRAVSRFGSDDPAYRELSAKLLGTVLHCQRGTPYVYQGEELGMTNAPFTNIRHFHDIESVNYHRLAMAAGAHEGTVLTALAARSRDNARTPMHWNAGRNAGFTTGTPWMAVNPNHATINVAAQRDDPNSVFNHYRRLIGLRHAMPVMVHGRFTMLEPDHERLFAFTRTLDAEKLLVVANFGSDPLGLPDAIDPTGSALLLGNYEDEGHPSTLRPWEARIYTYRGQ